MIDVNGNRLFQGEEAIYKPPGRSNRMKCKIISTKSVRGLIEIQLSGDPYPSWVSVEDMISTRKGASRMPSKPTVKALRLDAKNKKIEGWEDMDREELEAALAEYEEPEDDDEDDEFEDDEESEDEDDESEDDEDEDDEEDDDDEDEDEDEPAPRKTGAARKRPAAKKAVAKKAPAKKATTKKVAAKKAPAKKVAAKKSDEAAEVAENGNPYREKSNLWYITEQLIKGGKRSVMVTRLLKRIDLKPRVKGGKDYDESEELDYRIVRTCQQLKNEYGFVLEREGRGKDQRVKAIPPQDQ